MTQEKMNQMQVEAYELSDEQLDMIAGGRGGHGHGGSIIRDVIDIVRHLVEKHGPSND